MSQIAGKDLKVQIAGDESQLNRALDRAEGRMVKYTASVDQAAAAQAKAYQQIGHGADYAAARNADFAASQESSSRRVQSSLGTMAAAHAHAMQRVGDSTVATGRKINSAGSSILQVVAPIDLAAAAVGKLSVDFARSMELLHTQANYSQREVAKLSQSVLELAPKVGASPKEISEGLYHVASAGFKAADAMDIVKEAMIGARLGLASADETTYALVSVMKSAPKDIHNAADAMGLMNSIVGQGDMRMQQLVDALSTGVVPAAKAAGLGFRDVGAALDLLTQRGMPAQMSATRLRQTFAFMEKQSSTAKKALEEIGIAGGQLGAEMQKPNGLLVAVELLKKHLDNSGKSAAENNRVLLTAFGGGRSSAAIQTLVQNVGELRKQYQTLPDSAKSVQHLNQVWHDFQSQPAQQLAKDQQEVNVALIEMGSKVLPAVLPTIKELAGTVADLAEGFSHLSPGTQKAILDAALLGTAMGLAAKPIGGLITVIGHVEKGFGSAAGAATRFGRSFGAELETVVPAAEAAGAQAGTVYGTAFAATAERGIAEVQLSTRAASGGVGMYDIAGMKTKVPGFGPRAGIPGLGPTGFTAADQMYPIASREAAATGLTMKAIAGNAMKGGILGLMGVTASQIAGAAVGGHTGSVISGVGTDASIGAAIGTAIAPGLGTAIGGGLGAIAGALDHISGGTPGSRAAHDLANHPGGPHLGGKAETTFAEIKAQEEAAIAALPHTGRRRRGVTFLGPADVAAERRIQTQFDPRLGAALGKTEEHYLLAGTKFPDMMSVVATAKSQLAELGPAGKKAYAQMMVSGLQELEHGHRVQKGETAQFLADLGKQYSGLKGIAGVNAKAAAEVLSQELKGTQALKSAEGFVNELHKTSWSQIPKVANVTSTEAGAFFKTNLDKLTGIIETTTGLQKVTAERAYRELRDQGVGYFSHLRTGVEAEISGLSHHMGPMSAQGIKDLEARYQALAEVIEQEVESGVRSTAEGTKQINAIFQSEGKALGINIVTAGIGAISTADKAIAKSSRHKAIGGWVGQKGEKGRDEVPVWLGRGEAIINHDQQPYTEIGLATSKAMGIQPYGSLRDLFSGVQTKHYAASGGIVAPRVSVAGDIGRVSQAVLNKEAAAANSALAGAGNQTSGAAPTGGGFSPSQLGVFDGLQVARWIIPELKYARAHGWSGPVTSGYRAGYDPHAAGGHSMHALDIYPGGAVDFGGMEDPAGAANRASFISATAGYAGHRLLTPIGFRDDGHMSGTGHAGGGFVATAYGPPWEGIQGSGVTATGVDLRGSGPHGTTFPHKYIVAVDPSVIPLGSEMKIWPNPFGYTGNFLAADTGGAIKGNRIDFYDWQGRSAQNAWGRRSVNVTIGGTVTGGKKHTGLSLSGGQESHVRGMLDSAARDRSARTQQETYVGDIGGSLETAEARWQAEPKAGPGTPQGQAATHAWAETNLGTDQDKTRLYQRELAILNGEARKWKGLETYFRRLARRQHGTAKKQALDKAATYAAKLRTAIADTKVLKGTIYTSETKTIEDQGTIAAEPLSNYEATNAHIDAEERAGNLTPAQAKAAKEANASSTLARGGLSEEGTLKVQGDLRELAAAATASTEALQQHTQALEAVTKSLHDFLAASSALSQVENGSILKSMADLISGQIAGKGYHAQRLGAAGAGDAASY